MPRFVDLEKLSYKCASLVKIGANHVELLLAAHTDISPCRKWVASPVFFRLGLSQNPKPKNQTSDLGLFSGLACLVQANFCPRKPTCRPSLRKACESFAANPSTSKRPAMPGASSSTCAWADSDGDDSEDERDEINRRRKSPLLVTVMIVTAFMCCLVREAAWQRLGASGLGQLPAEHASEPFLAHVSYGL